MAREKKPVHKVQMTDGKRNIIQQLLLEYDIQSAKDIRDALKNLPSGTIKEMMETEMDKHLGYEKSNILIMMITVMVLNPSASKKCVASMVKNCIRKSRCLNICLFWLPRFTWDMLFLHELRFELFYYFQTDKPSVIHLLVCALPN